MRWIQPRYTHDVWRLSDNGRGAGRRTKWWQKPPHVAGTARIIEQPSATWLTLASEDVATNQFNVAHSINPNMNLQTDKGSNEITVASYKVIPSLTGSLEPFLPSAMKTRSVVSLFPTNDRKLPLFRTSKPGTTTSSDSIFLDQWAAEADLPSFFPLYVTNMKTMSYRK